VFSVATSRGICGALVRNLLMFAQERGQREQIPIERKQDLRGLCRPTKPDIKAMCPSSNDMEQVA